MSLFNTMLVHINNPEPWEALHKHKPVCLCNVFAKTNMQISNNDISVSDQSGCDVVSGVPMETEAKGSRERADSMMCLLFCHDGCRKIKGVGVILKERGPDRIMSLKLEIQLVMLNVVNISLL